jgi:hypothetical protein
MTITTIYGLISLFIQAAQAQGQVTPELRQALDNKAIKWAHYVEESAVIAIIALMVFKPF